MAISDLVRDLLCERCYELEAAADSYLRQAALQSERPTHDEIEQDEDHSVWHNISRGGTLAANPLQCRSSSLCQTGFNCAEDDDAQGQELNWEDAMSSASVDPGHWATWQLTVISSQGSVKPSEAGVPRE